MAYVPLSFAPGEAYQFDWSLTVIVKVAHVRLCHSRMLFARAYPRETQEMVFDARDRAFALFKGTCGRGIYDNMKTAVETIFVGKDRRYNRRFMQMCSHYLVDPVAPSPASGWEKGQVENQVGLVRERFFTPRLRFKTLDELNAWLLDKCIAYAKAHRHAEGDLRLVMDRSRSITQMRHMIVTRRRIDSNGDCANLSRPDQPWVGKLDMSDHSEVTYSTADGMDYPAHEQQYQTFIKIGTIATAAVITIVVLMAIFLT